MISDTTRDEVNLLSEKASLDLSQLNYRAAAAKFGEAASLLTSQDPPLALALMIQQAKALWDQGHEFGDNEALSEAIAIYQRGLSLVPVTTFPLLWAQTQRHLGIALGVLGERESGTGRLEEAVTAFRAALDVQAREQARDEWSVTQVNLGNTLLTLGQRTGDRALFERSRRQSCGSKRLDCR